ncbi:helix-turn-helix transcriptional regulator [Rugosimonospora acidiphila]|uniref:Helix-turn-helix transcriptional regulator n=1 Tax=Rugosimonospora acidiphila TaxID=556531 RepID=A0ABP9SPL0_9ACTN
MTSNALAGDVNATQELGAFLRSRRERLSPGEVMVPGRRRARRTPGLRREEVAELAGVSVDYVTRLEQGRGLRPSTDVLDALSRALRLSDDERVYLFDLTQRRPAAGRRDTAVPGMLDALVRGLSPLPAMLINHRFDIVAWNPEMSALMLGLDELPARRRNTLWLCLLHPPMVDFYVDRERIIREGIADLRAAWAAYPDDEELPRLVAELASRSEEFARLWERRDVRVNARGRKRVRHPVAGPLALDYEVLVPLGETGHRLVVYRAADTASQVALDELTTPAAAPAALA